jgi:hypothetical protein
MGVPAVRGHLISLVAHDHPGPPGHHRGRGTQPDRTFLGIPRHLSEPQLPGTDRAEQLVPACDLAAQHVDDDEVIGQYRTEQIMIGSEQGGEERLVAREDLAGADVVVGLHGSPPDDQPGFAYAQLVPWRQEVLPHPGENLRAGMRHLTAESPTGFISGT